MEIPWIRLQKYLDPDKARPKYLSATDERNHTVNPEFEDWEQQDNLLVSWLLSSMSEKTTNRIIGCDTTAQIWHALNEYYTTLNAANIGLYKTQLGNIKMTEIEALLMAQSARIDKHTKNLDILKAEANLSHSRFNGYNPYNRGPYSAPTIPPGFNCCGPPHSDGFTGNSMARGGGPASNRGGPNTQHGNPFNSGRGPSQQTLLQK
uniref:UBN2_3 domain-containing protein n=1 Tax=Cannabis sativa TaxID=3483 RepID=A0A803NSJ5_CANSA